MITYKTYKEEFNKECPGAYSEPEIKQMYFDEYILNGINNGFKFTDSFLLDNLENDKIWWLNKHKFSTDPIKTD